MKKLIALLVCLVAFIGFRCSTNTYVVPKDDGTLKTTALALPSTKQNSLTNAKTFYPGKLKWNGTNYEADFGNGGTLNITGPYPYTSPPTPTFTVVSTNIPNATITSDQFGNFTESWIVLPSNPEVITVTYDESGFVQDIQINLDPQSNPFVLTLIGKIVLIGSEYYAVTTDFQVPGQPVTPITPPAGQSTVTIHNVLGSQYASEVQYSRNGGDWTNIVGSTYHFSDPDDVFQFRAFISNAPGYQVPATFNLVVDGHTTSSSVGYTVPTGGFYLTNPTTKISNTSFTVTVNAIPLVAVQLSNLTNSGATLVNPQYSLDGGVTWSAFTSTIYVSANTSIKYRGTITCVPGQPQVDEIITPGGTTLLTNQSKPQTLISTSSGYNGGNNGYTVTFQNATY